MHSGQANCLLMRYQLRGDPRHLDEAISAQRLAAQRTPPDVAGLPDRLQHLAIALTTRYDLTRDTGDFDEAITSLQIAIQLAADDRAELHVCAAALGECMRRFYASAGLEGVTRVISTLAPHARAGVRWRSSQRVVCA